MQSNGTNNNHQGNVEVEVQNSGQQANQAHVNSPQSQANAADTPKPPLVDKAQQKLKKKKLDQDEKKQSSDAEDEIAAQSADDNTETMAQDGNASHAVDNHKVTARKTDGAIDEVAGTSHTNNLALDKASGISGPNSFSNSGKQFLAANTAAANTTMVDASSPMAGVQAAPAVTHASGISGWAWAGLAALGIGAAAGGGGGGGSHHSGSTPHAVSQTSINGIVMAGPVLPGVGLSVKAYALDGRELGSSAVNDNGAYRIILPAGYNGPARITLIDGNGNAVDYWDEAAGQKDINELSAIGNVRAGQSNIIMLTPLTNLAASKLAGQTPTESQINAMNKAVADLFGIDDIVTTTPIPVVTQTGANNLANANTYGKALAILSAAEKKLADNADPDPAKTVLDTLVNALPNGTTPASNANEKAAKDMLLDGLQDAATQGQVDNATKQALESNITTALSPASPSVALMNDTGVADDSISRDGRLTVTGIASGHTWQFSLDGGSTWKAGSGNGIPASELGADGGKSVLVRQINDAGNPSPASAAYSFTLDTTGPVAPVVSLTQDTGNPADAVTSKAELSVSGLEANASWEYSLDNGNTWIAGNSGNSIPASAFTSQGLNNVKVRQTDIAGNVGDIKDYNFTLDTIKPSAPSVALTTDSGSSNTDGITNDAALTVSGLESGASWEYSLDNGNTWIAGNSGNSIPASAFTEGLNSVKVRQTDIAGNVSDIKDYSFTLDTIAPTPTVTIDKVTGDDIVNSAEATQNVSITGTVSGAKTGDSVKTILNGTEYSGSVAADNSFSISVPGSVLAGLAAKKVTVSVSTTDDAGNSASATSAEKSYVVDLASVAPIISVNDITADNMINISEVSTNINITGTAGGDARAGDTITITFGNKTYITNLVDNNGHLEYSQAVPGSELKDYTSVTVRVDSQNGPNTGSASAEKTYTVDTIAPAPTITINKVAGDDIVNSSEATQNVTITGTVTDARTGDIVKTTLNGTEYSGSVAADNSFSISVPGSVLAGLADKKVSVTILATDLAGNTGSASSAEKTYSVDTTAPGKPVIVIKSGQNEYLNNSETSIDLEISVDGLTAGDTIQLKQAGVALGSAYSVTATDVSNGKVSINVLRSALSNGSNSITASVTNHVGNSGLDSDATVIIVDTIAPAPTITINTVAGDDIVNSSEAIQNVTITGTVTDARAGDSVKTTLNGQEYSGSVAADGSFSISVPGSVLAGLADKKVSVTILATDLAGNTGSATSAEKTYTVDTIAPVPSITTNNVTADNVLNATEALGSVNITGTVGGDAKAGDVVTVIVGEFTYSGTVASDKSYSIPVPGSALAPNTELSVSVSTSDAAGNIGINTITKLYEVNPTLDLNGAASGTTRKASTTSLLTPVQLMPQAELVHPDIAATFKYVELKATGVAAGNDDKIWSGASSQTASPVQQGGNTTFTVVGQSSGNSVWNLVQDANHYRLTLQGNMPATLEQVNDMLNSLYIRNQSPAPLQGERRYEVTVVDNHDSLVTALSILSLDSMAPTVDLNGINTAGNNFNLSMLPGAAAVAIVSPQALVKENTAVASLIVKTSSAVNGALDKTASGKAETLGLSDGNDADGMTASLRIGVVGTLENTTLISGKKLILTMAADGTLTISADSGSTLTEQEVSQILQALRYSAESSTVMGDRTLTVTVSDQAGNVSTPASVTLKVNQANAATITLDAASDTGALNNDYVTANNGSSSKSLIFKGSAPAGTTVTIFDDVNGNGLVDTGETLGTATANGSGAWSYTLNNKTLSDGAHRISAKAGSAEAVTFNLTIDTQAPASTFSMGDSVALKPVLSGTTDANAKVKVELDTDGNVGNGYEVSYETTSDSNGRWTLDTATATPNSGTAPSYSVGSAVNAKVTTTDLAGNESSKTASSTAQSSQYSISDSQVIEGSSGTREMVFLITRSGDTSQAGSVEYERGSSSSAKTGGSTSDNDYTGTTSGTVNFAAGETIKAVKITINGDNYREVNEKIVLNLKNPLAGSISDGVGVGQISEIDVSKLQAAYGLRDLNPQSNDYAIRVRRGSDNSEKDIGFDANGNLDTKALLDFVGTSASSKGYVTIWYDQSGNQRNMTQTDANKQGVIVDGGQVLTRADGSAAVSFNDGKNGITDDTMSANGAAANDWKSTLIYAKVQAQGNTGAMLFNLGGADAARLGAYYPAGAAGNVTYPYGYFFDVNSAAYGPSPGRLIFATPDGSLQGKANDIVFSAHAGRTSAGTVGQNYTDAAQAIFENGVRVASDGTLESANFSTASTWTLASGVTTVGTPVLINEFMVYLSKDNNAEPTVQSLLGTAGNDVLTYSGESNLQRIDGLGGDDALYISGAVNLNLTTLTQGMSNIECIYMDNGAANTLTLTDANITANGASSLTIIMGAGDKVVFNGVNYNQSADLQALIIGNNQANVLLSTAGNDRMIGGAGADTFTWLANQSGKDTVQDYSVGQGDKLDISKLLQGFTAGNESQFMKKEVVNGEVTVLIDKDGGSSFTPTMSIVMQGLAATDPITIITAQGSSIVL